MALRLILKGENPKSYKLDLGEKIEINGNIYWGHTLFQEWYKGLYISCEYNVNILFM